MKKIQEKHEKENTNVENYFLYNTRYLYLSIKRGTAEPL